MLFGPQAVGKMTVGQELEKTTSNEGEIKEKKLHQD